MAHLIGSTDLDTAQHIANNEYYRDLNDNELLLIIDDCLKKGYTYGAVMAFNQMENVPKKMMNFKNIKIKEK